jgi:hypothetical protein
MSENANRMNVRSQLFIATLAASALTIGVLDEAAGAGRHIKTAHWQKYRQVAHLDLPIPGNIPCRTGWWQTLRYGHVRSHWGTVCY